MLLTLNAQEDCIHVVTVLDQFTQSALLSRFPSDIYYLFCSVLHLPPNTTPVV